MTGYNNDDVFYVCTLIEYIARVTHNHRKDVLSCIPDDGLLHLLNSACVNHCLGFEEVSDEVISEYQIPQGVYDTVTSCKYSVPSVTSIGRVYQQLVLSLDAMDVVTAVREVFSSFISDEISDFNSSVYYSNPSYLLCSYKSGYLLD